MYDVFFTTIKLSVCRTNGLSVQVGKLAQVWLLSRFACALALAGLRVCGHEQATTRLTLRADLEHNQRALPEGGSFRAVRQLRLSAWGGGASFYRLPCGVSS